jgi:TldD protein
MKSLSWSIAPAFLFAHCLIPALNGLEVAAVTATNDVLLSTMERELHRAQGDLGKLEPAPYFMSYAVHDQNITMAVGSQGSLVNSIHAHTRTADVIVRVGTPALDNAHEENRASAISFGTVPLANDADAISHVLWQLTYGEYRKASQAYLNVKTKTQVNAKEEDTSPDFSAETSQVHRDYSELAAAPDPLALQKMVRRYSGWLSKYPYVYRSWVMVMAEQTRRHFVSTEGTRVVAPSTTIRLVIEAETQADDGMELMRVDTFQAETAEHLPIDTEIAARVDKIAADLKVLRAAPLAEPYSGPALLSGRAAAVFFHEVLGHRLEGHRQRGEQEGQTFTKKVNQQVLPEFLTVIDDPTERILNGVRLAGWYEYDGEGVPSGRVEVIQKGVLKSFLMSRMPIKGFGNSNGHGRAQPGSMPTGRQGNLIVTSSRTVKDAELRKRLIDEVKKQGKPYGLYFEDIEGGFTLTQRALPQAFEVLPILVWRVYPDGRPDELVRGVDIVGTPLTAMGRILLTGEKTEVFNGVCGAESGSVPVSAAAPAMLFSEIEVQKRAHSLNRPPILPPPGFESGEATPQRKMEPGNDAR